MGPGISSSGFEEEVRRLRDAYAEKRSSTNLVPPNGRPILDQIEEIRRGTEFWVYWFDLEVRRRYRRYQYIRLANIPNTLSGGILRLERNLPELDNGNYEIIGDEIHPVLQAPSPPPEDEDDPEDVSEVIADLPELAVDPQTCFLKKSKYRSEVRNLLLCQGGVCPGVPQSAHVVQLLGKSASGDLIFPRMKTWTLLCFVYPLAKYKEWILQLVDGLQCLHAHGIVHRDLKLANLLFSSNDSSDSRLLICDLEGRWENRSAPEVSREPKVDCGWTEKSDIYDVGLVIKGMIYGNNPLTSLVDWKVPSPLEDIANSCMCVRPEGRSTLKELHDMVADIEI